MARSGELKPSDDSKKGQFEVLKFGWATHIKNDRQRRIPVSLLGKEAIQKTLLALLVMAAVGGVARPTLAQAVPVCDALTLYGNAFNRPLTAGNRCLTLTPTTQTHWVCSLPNGNLDVHLTLNQATALHITVRGFGSTPSCDRNSPLTGTWPLASMTPQLMIQPGSDTILCSVNVGNIVENLNKVEAVPPAEQVQPNQFRLARCRQPFLDALKNGADPSLMQSYLDACDQNCQQ